MPVEQAEKSGQESSRRNSGSVAEDNAILVHHLRLQVLTDRQMMHEVEVLRVDCVDHHYVRMTCLDEAFSQPVITFLPRQFRRERYRLTWSRACPDPNQAVLLSDRPRANSWDEIRGGLPGYFRASAFRAVFPVVEEAAYAVALYFSLGQMRSHMWAVGVKRDHAAIFASINHQLAAKKVQRGGDAFFQLGRTHSPIPAFDYLVRA